mmetsp:Transcript_24279/g.47218  ORF Transcript_24279/g.47218 Transcript_24279/m.47218 type:complete len:448 (+) Transcript_24279:50-1393(+)
MSHHTASTRRASIEHRPVSPLGYTNPAQSVRSARRSLGEAGGLLLRSGHGLHVGGSAAAAAAEGTRAGASTPQSLLLSAGSRNHPSTISGEAVLPSARRLTQPTLPVQQQPQPRSRRAASLNLNNAGVRSREMQLQVSHHTSNRANAASSTEQGDRELLMRFQHRFAPQSGVAASSHNPGHRGGEAGMDPDETAMAAALENGNRELLARVRELAVLQGQLLVLQQGTATLQATIVRARRGEGGDVFVAPANRDRRGSTAADQARVARTESSAEADNGDMALHPFTCDGCGAGPPLVGRVMKCIECDDYDLCARCYADQDHSGHPSGHQFRQRVTSEDTSLSQQLMLRVLESTMLHEALRRSSEGDMDREAAEKELAEVHAVETISALPRVTWAPQSKCSECALCLEEYTEGEEILKLSCNHLFHEGCIGPWLVKSLSCPLCQKEVSA